MRPVRVVVLLLSVLGIAVPSWSQTGTSTVRGVVTDQQGQVIAGATVTLTNAATNTVHSMKSSETGSFVFDLITPADYRLEVEAKGFRKKVVDHVKALIGKQTESNVQLEVGASNEVVEVQASAQEAIINTEDATLGNNFESIQITQLPLEARSLIDLLTLQPGSTREGYVTGARADQSNVTLDGVDINNAQTSNAAVPLTTNTLVIGQLPTDRNNITDGPVLRLNSEAIEEFRVTTANGNANQGRSSGSQVNLVTRSGTNSWHGAGFELYRSRGFTANDWFNNHSGVARPPLQRNTFGGGIGGPIVKNKAFFFYSYEGRHDASGLPQTEVVPLNNVFGDGTLGDGVIHYTYPVPGRGCPGASAPGGCVASLSLAQNQQVYSVAGINPAATAALAAAIAKYPANDPTQGDGLNTGGFRFNAPTPIKLNSHVLKLDFNLTNKQEAFVRLNVIYDHQTLPRWLPDTPSPLVWNHPRGLAVGHTWTIGNNLVNNLRYGYTRQAFSQTGDSYGNDISFRFVFQPNGQQHTFSRVTPVHNITDDISWIHGKHNLQFGVNIRKINNNRISYANAFDNAITNPSFYLGAGANVSDAFQAYLDANSLPGSGGNLVSITEVQNAGTAIIGRLSEYTANFTFGKDGSLLAAGVPTVRDFATQAYDSYFQDTWKASRNLTLTLGLRYSLERPVYETQGFQVGTGLLSSSGTCQDTSLGAFFQMRQAAAAQGNNFTTPICINRSGPANGGKPMYNSDYHEFQPRLAFAFTPDGGDGFLGRLLGHGAKSVVRGGFAITNDYYGQALAVDFDLNNTLGFTSSYNINANTFDTTNANTLGPLFTGFGQDVRSLPQVVVPPNLTFPVAQPSVEREAIESSINSHLTAPREYVWNLTFERQLPKDGVLSISYIGRMAKNLLARQDVAAFNDVVDPQSHMDWYTAATMLEKQRAKGVDTSQIASIPFFDNLFPANLVGIVNNDAGVQNACGSSSSSLCFDPTWTNTQMFYGLQSRGNGSTIPSNPYAFFNGNDWTDAEAFIDIPLFNAGLPTRFMHPQYGSLSVWSTVAHSNYNALAVSLRQRLHSLTLDFNYTFAHSLDNASGLQTGGGFATDAFIVNPLRPNSFYGNSSFDVRQNVNADAVWELPFGKGQAFLSGSNRLAQAALGGWQLSGIFRWNTGLPATSPYDAAQWATNWNVQANATPLSPLHTCPSRPAVGDPKLFGGSSCNLTAIYQSFRNAYPGETGPRNYIRLPGYVDLEDRKSVV